MSKARDTPKKKRSARANEARQRPSGGRMKRADMEFEIRALRDRVRALRDRVRELEARPVYVPVPQPPPWWIDKPVWRRPFIN